ncbi:MAG: PA14 domain-containing protein, partial [Bacteroidota bacterium]
MELNVWKKNYTNILTLSALLWRIFLLLLVTLGVSYNVSSTSLNQLHNATSGQSYNIPLRNGGYQITFIFKKTSEMSKGSISVQAEGKQIIGNLDGSGFSDARPSFSIERTVVVSDGELNIEYSSPVAKLAFFLKETEASSGPIDNSAPVVQLIQPSDATYIEGDDITLVAEVSDSDGRVTKASFWVDGEQVNEQSLSIERGYVTYTWPAVSAGVYQVQARVQDDQGETSTSSVLAYKIGNGDGSSSSPEAPDEPGTPPPPTAEEGEPGLRYAYYVGEWSSLPDFDQLTPTSQGVLPNFAFTPAIGKLYTMGFVYEGYLLVEQAGEYTFYVNANDGSNFYLDGEEIINNDGRKDEALEKSGRVQLSAGYHPIRLTFFERWGPQVLEVRYQGPGVSLQSIPDNKLFLNAPEDEIGTSEPVVIPNNPPVVNAGSDIKITLPQSEVSLQADASDEDGTIVSYQWSTVSGNSVAIANPNSAQTSVTDLEEGTYYFAIRVEDDDEDTATDTVKVIVEPAPNIAPSVDAGNDIEITLPQTEVVLSATATDEGGTITSYQWSTVSDGSVTINNPTSAQTEVTNLQEGVYQFVVTVTDNRAATASDTVEVVVKTAPIVENKEPRLNYAYYEGEWSNMPDFNQITAVESGTVANFDISNRQRDEYFGFAFTGYIDIQTAGTYRFYTTSDDGSALYIDGKKVVDNDGRHSRQERSGSVRLSKGKYPIRVVFFEHAGHEVLEVHYQGPGIDKMLIPDEVLSLEGDPVSDVPVIEEDNLIYVNFHRQGRDEAEGWNNVNRSEQSLLLENADGTSSYATLKLETNWGGDNHKGFTTGNNTGKYADAV